MKLMITATTASLLWCGLAFQAPQDTLALREAQERQVGFANASQEQSELATRQETYMVRVPRTQTLNGRTTTTFVQEQRTRAVPQFSQQVNSQSQDVFRSGVANRRDLPPQMGRVMGLGPSGDGEVNKALVQLREAKTDDEKKAAEEGLKESLGKQYDIYLAQHEKQLAQLEQRLEELRTQLKKKTDAKDELVELRLKTMLSEADGLGWPTQGVGNLLPKSNGGAFRVASPFGNSRQPASPFEQASPPNTSRLNKSGR